MHVRAYLRNYRNLYRDIEAEKRRRDGLYSIVTGTGIRYDLDRVQTSPTGDKIDRVLSEVADLDKSITQNIEKLIRMQKRAKDMINLLDKPEYRAILTDYYINGYSWDMTADMNGYSIRHAKRIGDMSIRVIEREYCRKI